MGNDSNPKRLTASATTTLGAVYLYGIAVNKTLTGTMTVDESDRLMALFAIGTTPGTYHLAPNGTRYANLTIALSAADDVTVLTRTAS